MEKCIRKSEQYEKLEDQYINKSKQYDTHFLRLYGTYITFFQRKINSTNDRMSTKKKEFLH